MVIQLHRIVSRVNPTIFKSIAAKIVFQTFFCAFFASGRAIWKELERENTYRIVELLTTVHVTR